MESTNARKRARVDESEDEEDCHYPQRYRPPPFCPDCGARSHPGDCRPRCHRCDRRHVGVCTAFCKKCTDIGHSWRHCRLFIPNHIWRKERCGLNTTIQNVNITAPVIDPAPTCTPTSLNAALLCQLDIALHGLHRKAGVPNHSRLMLNNVNITTNIIAAERKAPVAPDTSLFDRVQRIPTGPRSNIPNTRSAPTKPTFAQTSLFDRVQHIPTGPRSNIPNSRSAPTKPPFAQTSLFDRVERIPTAPRSNISNTRPVPTEPTYVQPAFARPAFAPSVLSQPVFGQTAFS